MKAPKRIQVSFSTGDDWPVPIRESAIPARTPVKRAKFRPGPDQISNDLVDKIVLLLMGRCRSISVKPAQ